MKHLFHFIILNILHLIFSSISFSATGILEVHSEPSGAKVYIDDRFVGNAPFSNPMISTGKHRIKVRYSDDFPEQNADVMIDEISPVIKKFYFKPVNKGKFVGVKQNVEVEQKKGNVQFASVPTGSKIYINGEDKGNTPLGYQDVGVGLYDVRFVLNDKEISGSFEVLPSRTEKIIANFVDMNLFSQSQEEARKNQELILQKDKLSLENDVKLLMSKLDSEPIHVTSNKFNVWISFPNGESDRNVEIHSSIWTKTRGSFIEYFTDRNGNKHTLQLNAYFKGKRTPPSGSFFPSSSFEAFDVLLEIIFDNDKRSTTFAYYYKDNIREAVLGNFISWINSQKFGNFSVKCKEVDNQSKNVINVFQKSTREEVLTFLKK